MSNKTVHFGLAVLAFVFVVPDRAAAWGGLAELFDKLSGPQIFIVSVQHDICVDKVQKRLEGCRAQMWTFRPILGLSASVNDEPAGVTGSIDVFQLEPTAVYRPGAPSKGKFSALFGLSVLRFGGDDFDTFWRVAPLAGAVYELGKGWEVGLKLRVFAESFNGQDFGGLATDSSGPELNWGAHIGWSF